VTAREKDAVLVSLKNRMTAPVVKSAADEDRLPPHGLGNDIGEGTLEEADLEDGYHTV